MSSSGVHEFPFANSVCSFLKCLLLCVSCCSLLLVLGEDVLSMAVVMLFMLLLGDNLLIIRLLACAEKCWVGKSLIHQNLRLLGFAAEPGGAESDISTVMHLFLKYSCAWFCQKNGEQPGIFVELSVTRPLYGLQKEFTLSFRPSLWFPCLYPAPSLWFNT